MSIDVYIEKGEKRVVAGALAWPGWCRIGRDEESALQSLFDYAPRYARVVGTAKVAFHEPADIGKLNVNERLKGTASTDFGVPDVAPTYDEQPIDDDELRRLQKILRACWRALEKASEDAKGKHLRLGPRGGGRDLGKINDHVNGAEDSYVRRLAWKRDKSKQGDEGEQIHQAALDALAAATHGELPKEGPRGGALWLPRYFVRRAAWHVLDHVWEIEDRIE